MPDPRGVTPQAQTVTPPPYTLREVSDASSAEWDDLLLAAPDGGHVYQSHAWGEFKRRSGWKPVRLILERDGRVAGAGEFLSYNTLPVPGSLWYCTKGPRLNWQDQPSVRAFLEGMRNIAREKGAHTVKIEPEVPEGNEPVKELLGLFGFRRARYDLNQKTTLVVDLTLPEEELLSRMKKATRYGVRRSAREGVEVVEPEDFDKGFEAFYALMRATAERKEGNFLRRPRGYLYDVMRAMHDRGQGNLFLATHEGIPLAAMYVFVFGEKYWYIYGASGDEKRNLQPNYGLQWEVMRWAKRRGLTRYDMVGIPSPDELDESHSLYSVYKFKAGFGGEVFDSIGCFDLPVRPRLAAAWYRLEPLYYRAYYKLKNDIFY